MITAPELSQHRTNMQNGGEIPRNYGASHAETLKENFQIYQKEQVQIYTSKNDVIPIIYERARKECSCKRLANIQQMFQGTQVFV